MLLQSFIYTLQYVRTETPCVHAFTDPKESTAQLKWWWFSPCKINTMEPRSRNNLTTKHGLSRAKGMEQEQSIQCPHSAQDKSHLRSVFALLNSQCPTVSRRRWNHPSGASGSGCWTVAESTAGMPSSSQCRPSSWPQTRHSLFSRPANSTDNMLLLGWPDLEGFELVKLWFSLD
jgi:hypothetical protein